MKRFLGFLILSAVFSFCTETYAQTNPGTESLAHQWTFDDGTANDTVAVNPVNGTLMGGATIENRALKLAGSGQYLSFSGSALSLDTFTVISQEIWYTPVLGANTSYTMLSYFGNTSGGSGYNYISTSSARGDDKSRTAITDGNYSGEVAADGPEYDDGLLHQMVSVIRADSVLLYIDGALVDKTANTVSLSTIGSSLAYLGKGGYTNDPTWIGSISKFSIYSKSLSSEEVDFLYQQGPESSPLIISSFNYLSFDDIYTSETINITGINLEDSIVITSPSGIVVDSVKLAPNANNTEVVVEYDGTSTVNGYIILKSGSDSLNIHVKSYDNSCFSKFYPDFTNLVPDPYVSDLSNFVGWGSRSINSDSAYVFCGARSGKVSGSGSLDVSLTGQLETNTQYHVKAKVYAIGGKFQIGVLGWSSGMGDYIKTISITDSWQDVDFVFTTGQELGSVQRLFFNSVGLSGTTGYIDNWEMYAEPKVYTSLPSMTFLEPGSTEISVRGVNLLEDIAVTTSTGFDVSAATLPAGSNGELLTVTFNGVSTTSGYIYFTSGTVKDSLFVSGSIDPLILTSVSSVGVDEIDTSAIFNVKGYNLTESVVIVAPAGISLSTSLLPSEVNDSGVTITYDGLANSSGYIVLTSSTAKDSVQIIAGRNDACFDLLYPDKENLIIDPTCNYYLTEGSGNKGINSDPDFVYCGARSGMVNNGSLDRDLTGILKPNTKYRMRAKAYKASETGENMGNVTFTLGIDSASNPEKYQLIKIAMDSACSYFSKHTPFVENIYVYYSAGIPTAQSNYRGSIGFGPNTRYMWVGTAIHEMDHYFGSGTTSAWRNLMVGGLWQGASGKALCKELSGQALKGDNNDHPVHFWPYGINQKEEITNLGSLAVQDKALADAVKIAKAMLVDDCGLPTNNPAVGIGVYGYDASKGDLKYEVEVPNTWQEIDFTFVTGAALKSSQRVYFNGGTGYIDNWELYEISMDATLSDLFLEGVQVDGFDASTQSMDIVLPASTTEVPTLSATATDSNATLVVTPATSLPGSTFIEVTAEDGTTKLTYTINFSFPSVDTRLSDLQVDSVTVDGFNSDTLIYDIVLPYGTDSVPTVTATAEDINAAIDISPATGLPGSTIVVVTAEDGITNRTYTINFTVEGQSYLTSADQGTIKVYPTISKGDFMIRTNSTKSSVKVYGFKGDVISEEVFEGADFRLSLAHAGIYIIKVENEMCTKTFKVIKIQ